MATVATVIMMKRHDELRVKTVRQKEWGRTYTQITLYMRWVLVRRSRCGVNGIIISSMYKIEMKSIVQSKHPS